MNSCFDNLVGLKGICDVNHNFYVNGLSGVTFKTFARVANEEYNTGANLFKAKYIEAVDKVLFDVLSNVKDFKFNHIQEYKQNGVIGTNFVERDLKFIGRKIVSNTSDPYLSAKLVSLEFYSNKDTSAKLYLDNEIIEIEVIEGLNTITINKQVTQLYLDTTCFDLGYEGFCTSCDNCNVCSDNCATVTATSGNDITDQQGISYGGLRLNIACVCDIYKFLCPYADLMKFAIRYQIGIQLLLEVIASEDTSYFLNMKKDQAMFWLSRWEGTPNTETGFNQRSEYWSEIKKISEQVKIGKSSCNQCSGIQIKSIIL